MYTDDEKKKKILYHAQRTMYFNDLLIKQCDSWLSEEEGLQNIEKRIREQNCKADAADTPTDKDNDNPNGSTTRKRNRMQTMLCKLRTSIIENCDQL